MALLLERKPLMRQEYASVTILSLFLVIRSFQFFKMYFTEFINFLYLTFPLRKSSLYNFGVCYSASFAS